MRLKHFLQPLVASIKRRIDEKRQLSYLQTEYVQQLMQLKNSAKEKRCFIIGNGPSLTISDLEKLKDEACFASNRIYGIYEKTQWRPTYYCSQDQRVIEQIRNDLPYAVDNCKYALFSYKTRKNLPSQVIAANNVRLFYAPYVSVYSKDGRYPEGIMPFSDDISRAVYDGLSITYAMIQMAVYMGYKEIYLLGIDHNYPMINGVVDAGKSYAEGIKPIDMRTQYPPELELCENSFRGARRYCEAHDVQIFNATRGGKLEVFERIDLDTLIGGLN